MSDLLENCSDCYQSELSQFPDEIIIIGDLSPDAEYYFKFTDKFNNSFVTEAIETDSEGTANIVCFGSFANPSSLSPAWFNNNAGSFLIEASETIEAWVPVNFTFAGITYNCIVVHFVNDDSGLNTIK